MGVTDFFMNRTLHFLIIDILLILLLIWVFKSGNISDHSMPICLLGTYIVFKFIFNALHMKFHPFKCGLTLCV